MARPKFDKDMFKRSVEYNVKTLFRKQLKEADDQQIFQAVSYAVKDNIIDAWLATQKEYEKSDPKTVYYLSMEFLMGRALGNNLINLTYYDEVKEALKQQPGVVLYDDPENNIDVSNFKWTSVKPGRLLKLANKKVEEGSYLIYRIAGENGKLPSTYLLSDEIRYDRLTYVGFVSTSKKTVGDTLEAVISTNVKADSVTYTWERYTPDANEEVDEDAIGSSAKWKPIENVTTSSYILQTADVGCYIRVTATSKTDAENTKTSEIIGPVKAKTEK